MTTPNPTKEPAKVATGLAGWFRSAGAFVFRDYHLTRRYFSWVFVFTNYGFMVELNSRTPARCLTNLY